VSRSALVLVGSVLAAGALAVAGCGAAPPPAPAAPPAAAPPTAAQQPGGHGGHGEHEGHGSATAPALYAVQSGPLGVIATDGAGHIMYRSDADSSTPPTSNCTGPCAQTWLPVLVATGEEPELLGVDPAVVGRITRPEGTTQLTLAGWPLYRDPDDPGGLRTTGRHGQDNTWFAITPTGEKASAG
jgi:predicted lipoprotein with Yx(FWY)xxD motif